MPATNQPVTPNSANGYAAINGINMYYEIHGSGFPLVLIHGGGSTITTSFGYVLPILAQQYQIIAVELQAHGRTSDRDAPESFEQDADDVAALLVHLSISKANFLGFSNGGSTAMQIAIRHPNVVNKLVLASALYKREGLINGFFDGMQHATLSDMPALLQKGYLQVNNSQAGLQTMFSKDRQRMLDFKDRPDADLQNIKAPAFIIVADRDVITTAHTLKMASLIPDNQLMVVPGTHGSYINEICAAEPGSKIPDAVVTMIIEFLNK